MEGSNARGTTRADDETDVSQKTVKLDKQKGPTNSGPNRQKKGYILASLLFSSPLCSALLFSSLIFSLFYDVPYLTIPYLAVLYPLLFNHT